jgi:hypothetical protein
MGNNGQEVIIVKDDSQQRTRAAELVKTADSLVVVSDLGQDQAASVGRDLKAYLNEVEKYFAPEIEQAHTLHKNLCAKRNAVIDPIKAAILRLGQKLGVYQDEQRRKIAEKEEAERQRAVDAEKKKQEELLEKAAKADGEGKTEKAEELLEKAENVYVAPRPVAPVVKPQGTALLFNVDVIVKDAKRVPDEFKIVDEAKLKRRFKESKYTLDVPGVVFVKKPVSSFRG